MRTDLNTKDQMRLDRFLAHSSGHSRSEVRRLLRQGAVEVDGRRVREADYPVSAGQRVSLHGQILSAPGPRYFMLHKPAGVVCARVDAHHRAVNGLLDEPRSDALFAAGRLDADATGLVLLTDDGGWAHGITHPRRGCSKVYLATLAEPLPDTAVQRFAEGLQLMGESRPTLPARLEILSPQRARVTLVEGRYHQVKRMFAALGNRVLSLHRQAIGGLQLDPQLAPGSYRPLTDAEVALLSGTGLQAEWNESS